MNTFSCVHVPQLVEKEQPVRQYIESQKNTYSTSGVVAATDDFIPTYVQAPNTLLMTFKDPQQTPALHIPDSQRRVSRASHRNWTIVQNLNTPYR